MKSSNRFLSARDSSSANPQNPRLGKDIRSRAEELKTSLLKKLGTEYGGLDGSLVYRAVTEAHALASLTAVPLLVLPLLAEEKVQQAKTWADQQRSVLQGRQFAFAA